MVLSEMSNEPKPVFTAKQSWRVSRKMFGYLKFGDVSFYC